MKRVVGVAVGVVGTAAAVLWGVSIAIRPAPPEPEEFEGEGPTEWIGPGKGAPGGSGPARTTARRDLAPRRAPGEGRSAAEVRSDRSAASAPRGDGAGAPASSSSAPVPLAVGEQIRIPVAGLAGPFPTTGGIGVEEDGGFLYVRGDQAGPATVLVGGVEHAFAVAELPGAPEGTPPETAPSDESPPDEPAPGGAFVEIVVGDVLPVAAEDPDSVAVADPTVVELVVSPEDRRVEVRGLRPGRSTLVVDGTVVTVEVVPPGDP